MFSSRRLIVAPFVILPLFVLGAGKAPAAGAAEEAVRILAGARTADARCGILSGSETAELDRYLARAEIAAASHASPKAARAAAATGSAEGRAMACTAETQTDVRETLEAARQAVAAANAAEPPEKPVRKADVKVKTGEKTRASGSGLARYDRIVQAYYLERECRSLSRAEADRFWKGIVRLHRNTVASNGVSAVAPVMRKAERRAQNAGCGSTVEARIRDGYEEVLSR